MIVKKTVVIFFCFLFLFVPVSLARKKRPPNFLSISELNQANLTFGTYETKGYIVRISTCLPCLEMAVCKPCEPDYIIISEKRTLQKNSKLTDKELIVFVHDAREFRRGDKGWFLIQILDVKTMVQKLNNIKLVYWEKI